MFTVTRETVDVEIDFNSFPKYGKTVSENCVP